MFINHTVLPLPAICKGECPQQVSFSASPTITPLANQSIGKDFSVSLMGTILTFGKNIKINLKSEVKVDFQHQYKLHDNFMIKPLNLSTFRGW